MRTPPKGLRLSKTLGTLAAVFFFAGCVSTAPAITTKYYSVSGTTGEQIDRELRKKGPLQGHALALAAIRFEPVSVFQEQSEESCVFTSAKFRVIANITLPRWQDRAKSRDRDLRRAWDGLARYAELHERTHVLIAEKYAEQLGEEIMALEPEGDCTALDREAKKVVDRVSRQHDRAQKKFDADEQKRLAELFGS